MSGFLYKPIGQGQIGGGRANFLIEDPSYVSGGFYDKDGNLIEKFDRFQGTPEPGQKPGVKFTAKKPGGEYGKDVEARFTDKNGEVHTYNLANGGQRYEGNVGDPTSLTAVNKGPQDNSTTGIPGQFQPGTVGQYGNAPAYIGNMFPSAATSTYNPISAAPYNFTDPTKFAAAFGNFNRGEINKNFDLSKDLALKELNTELSSLKDFVPAAAALKRNETSIDNQFNQSQRTAQVNAALPNAGADLEAQRQRANTYASGRAPDDVTNQALELGVRSAAADRAAAGGFGATSSVARKASDILSADQRIKLSQYGDSLLSSNTTQTAGLFLAPTEYSNAGSQVSVNPSVSASQLIDRNIAQINGLASIPATTGLASNTQQNQFTTGLQQNTNTFNASNTLQNSQFNTAAQNNFALSQFGYNAQYANSVAGAANANTNVNFQLQQQQMYQQLVQAAQANSQTSGLLSAGAGLVTSLIGGAGGLGGLTGKGGSTGSSGGKSSGSSSSPITDQLTNNGVDPNVSAFPGSDILGLNQGGTDGGIGPTVSNAIGLGSVLGF